MYVDYLRWLNPILQLTEGGAFPAPGTITVWEETWDEKWAIRVSVSGLYRRQPGFLTLHADIHDLYIIGEHRINPLQEAIRHIVGFNPPNQWSKRTNISRWSRTTWSGLVVGEIDKPETPEAPPFDGLPFSGMMRHFVADDGFWFGSTCIRFDATRTPYVAHADYPATGETSWWETEWIQDAVDMEYIESFDGGRMLVSTAISGLLILDTETTFDYPYPKSDLSALALASGVFVTDLDTHRTY